MVTKEKTYLSPEVETLDLLAVHYLCNSFDGGSLGTLLEDEDDTWSQID